MLILVWNHHLKLWSFCETTIILVSKDVCWSRENTVCSTDEKWCKAGLSRYSLTLKRSVWSANTAAFGDDALSCSSPIQINEVSVSQLLLLHDKTVFGTRWGFSPLSSVAFWEETDLGYCFHMGHIVMQSRWNIHGLHRKEWAFRLCTPSLASNTFSFCVSKMECIHIRLCRYRIDQQLELHYYSVCLFWF